MATCVLSGWCSAEIFLPGTQPKEGEIRVSKVKLCKTCHARKDSGKEDPFFSWQGGMMAQASRDPVYLAALAVANQDVPGVGEYCIRCHSPAGWLEGRSSAPDTSALTEHDKHGVSCDICHRLVDPRSDEARGLVKDLPPGLGNGMMVMGPKKVARGPYDDSPSSSAHRTMKSEFQMGGHLCGTCHSVSHPLLAEDVRTQPPHSYGHIERTYDEWVLSDYAEGPEKKTCQDCHYPLVEGGTKVARGSTAVPRDYIRMHGAVGGSTWVQDAIWMLSAGSAIDKDALENGKRRAAALLRTASSLEIKPESAEKAVLRITNLTGHKLPTGYPEGRRMWVNVRWLDAEGTVIKEIGRYGERQDVLKGENVTVPTLLDPEATTVYECKPGISEAWAKRFNKEPGPSFHFVLNDRITKDNRIPPKGFKNAAFKERLCGPVGAEYADGQYWDYIPLKVPPECRELVVRLYYQSVSWEYIKFLREHNHTNDAGRRLYEAWCKTGQCPPLVIAEVRQAFR